VDPDETVSVDASHPDAIRDTHPAAVHASPPETAPSSLSSTDPSVLPAVDEHCYDITGELARGGLGRILRARDRRLDRPVALKQVLDSAPVDVARFVREALITARLQHPAIVPVYEAGRFASGEPFYAMKLVSGRSLKEVIQGTARLEERLALLPHVLAVADAMAYAHSHRIIHRDLKPSNVLVGPFGETVVIDWGLAKDLRAPPVEEAASPTDAALAELPDQLTTAGVIVGTPQYMPPEQARGEPVDERADVYALGAMLYYTLTGAMPYEGESAGSVLARLLAAPPPPLAARQPDVPQDLAAIVRKSMARDPS
jgi:serine/threonine protein kinase